MSRVLPFALPSESTQIGGRRSAVSGADEQAFLLLAVVN